MSEKHWKEELEEMIEGLSLSGAWDVVADLGMTPMFMDKHSFEVHDDEGVFYIGQLLDGSLYVTN